MKKSIIIDESFWNIFPDASIAYAIVRNFKADGDVPDSERAEIAALLKEANEIANGNLVSSTISQNPCVAVWREAYTKFKKKKGARCSMENLMKRTLNGNPVGSIAPTVDISNAISLKYAFPVGQEDLDSIAEALHLGVSEEPLPFLPIGEDREEPSLPGEMLYYDAEGAVCRCMNWRDGVRTAVTDATRAATLCMENIEPDRIGDLQAALDEYCMLAKKYLDADIVVAGVLTKDDPAVEFDY